MLPDDIVISGVSGRLPECENVKEFWTALFEGRDLITEDDRRFPPGFLGTPRRQGKIPHPEKFDAGFFGINPKQANFMDCRHRIFLETTYESIIDAGYNPSELRGSNTGVYVAITNEPVTEHLNNEKTDGYFNQSIYTAMIANKTSYAFDFHGPSFSCDACCSSSYHALVCALNDLRNGVTEYAVVGAAHLIFDPHSTSELSRSELLGPDGKCKSFTAQRNGFVRSEGVITMFIQKRKNSRRIYATVLGGGINADGYKREGLLCPSMKTHLELMKSTFTRFNINAPEVTYFELHCAGTVVGDRIECDAVAEMLGNSKSEPLLIGSVKSNTGHLEVASGFAALLKIIAIFRTGVIPANLYIDKIDETLPGIKDNKLQVVSKNTPFKQGLIATSSLGFGGANAHIILAPNEIQQQKFKREYGYRLVFASGRTLEAVNHFLDNVVENQNDSEFLTLVDGIHRMNIEGHNYRGYTILQSDNALRKVQRYTNVTPPVWFIYPGMGCQWITMGRDLLKINIFRETLDRCATALRRFNIDLHHAITSDDPSVFDDITVTFVAITAIQVALTDVLRSLNIHPDGFAGHSLGEVACGYLNGSLSVEQTVLLSYARGYSTKKIGNKSVKGLMVAVGLSKNDLIRILPEGIFIACQNSSESVTISGPEDITRDFANQLKTKGVFAKEVNSGNVAYHSKYVYAAEPYFKEFVSKILDDPKPRSQKWISTSVPPERRHENWAKLDCTDYHWNNYCNPVLFEQVYAHVPDNAIVVEIAPHGLLQGILKRQLPSSVINVPLTQKQYHDGEEHFYSAIGKIYLAGYQPQLGNMFGNTTLPVSAQAAPLSPLVKWDHSQNWLMPTLKPVESSLERIHVSLSDPEYSHLQNHEVDGKCFLPGMTYLVMAWRICAKLYLKNIEDFPVKFERISFHRITTLTANDNLTFFVNVAVQTGFFEIFESGSLVVTGKIRPLLGDTSVEFDNIEKEVNFVTPLKLNQEDFYKECRIRKYIYKDEFQGIIECDLDGYQAKIEWKEKFDCFLDNMIQINLLQFVGLKDLFLPTFLQNVVIDPRVFLKAVSRDKEIVVINNDDLGITQCEGVRITGLNFSCTSRRQNTQALPILETFEFVCYDKRFNYPLSLQVALEIVLQNRLGVIRELKICEIQNVFLQKSQLMMDVKNILEKKPLVETEYFQIDQLNTNLKYDLILLQEQNLCCLNGISVSEYMSKNGFIIYQGPDLPDENFEIILQFSHANESFYLLRLSVNFPVKYSVLNIDGTDFTWVETLKNHLKKTEHELIYLFSENTISSGVIGLTNCLMREPSNVEFRFILTDNSQEFSIDSKFFKDQLKKDLVYNVLRGNRWGTFVHIPYEPEEVKASNTELTITTLGDFSTLQWIESSPICTGNNGDDQLVDVFYSALNFKDILLAAGKLQQSNLNDRPMVPDVQFGFEYSGLIGTKKVMGLTIYGGFSLQVRSDPVFIWEVPHSWSLEDAATVPMAYVTSYYALVIRGNMRSGESVLIHSGAGGVGLSAISIALSAGCIVFTTVSTTEKKNFLMDAFPQLKEENIGDSRSVSFEKMIKKMTNGKGVDIVLNSLTGELFQASINCLAQRGRFLELGKVEFMNRTSIDSHIFLKNCSFNGIFVDDLFHEPHEDKFRLQKMLAEGIASGVVKPIHRTVFSYTKVENAFRYLSTGKHIGKVLIRLREESPAMINAPTKSILATAKVYFNPNKSYIIVGGLGGVGLELAKWLIIKGAKKIILNSRRGITNGYQALCLKTWRQLGITVEVNTNDTTKPEETEKLLAAAGKYGPVGGIFNLALVLKEKLMINNTIEDFEIVFGSKFQTTKNIDEVSRNSCPELEHFVIFSTLISGRGFGGQTSYGMASSAVESLCETRTRANLPALAVQYSFIGEVGAMLKTETAKVLRDYLEPLSLSSCFDSLEKLMLQPCAVGASTVLGNKSGNNKSSASRSPAEAVAHILGIRCLDDVDKSLKLLQYGVDSLMLGEIKQTLNRNYQIDLDLQCIQELTFEQLINMGNTKDFTIYPSNSESGRGLLEIIEFQTSDQSEDIIIVNTVPNSKEQICKAVGKAGKEVVVLSVNGSPPFPVMDTKGLLRF